MSEPVPADLVHRLEAAHLAVAEHERLSARLERAHATAAQAEEQVATARSALADETQDVERLESFNVARIWAGLTGHRDADLDRERAEQQAAAYAVARAEAGAATAGTDVRGIEAQLGDLGDPLAERTAALAEKERWLRAHGAPESTVLDAIAADVARIESELRETAEALAAADQAQRALAEAAGHLDRARGWATYDTFFGGGMIADSIKYDRINEAHAQLRVADEALRRLAAELADVGMEPVGEVGVSAGQQTFDVFFDNVFSDSRVRSQVIDTQSRASRASTAVDQVQQRLAARDTGLRQQLEELAGRRQEILGAPPAPPAQ